MSMKKLLKVTMTFMFIFSIAGCGSDGDSETNGTLTLSAAAPVDTGAKTVTMTATAVLTPARTGSEISFTTLLFNASGALPLPPVCSRKESTNPTGTVTISCNFPQPAVDATLQVSATSGGLSATAAAIPIAGSTP